MTCPTICRGIGARQNLEKAEKWMGKVADRFGEERLEEFYDVEIRQKGRLMLSNYRCVLFRVALEMFNGVMFVAVACCVVVIDPPAF